MRPLSRAERAAILAEHPGTTDADLDRFLADVDTRLRAGAVAEEQGRRLGGPPDDDPFPRMAQAIRRAHEQEEGEA